MEGFKEVWEVVVMVNVPLCFRGERDVWLVFVSRAKLENKRVWGVLKPLVLEYLRGGKK